MSIFISFEGGEGSGKTTQSKILEKKLRAVGKNALLVRDPGTTPLGLYLRDWLKRERKKDATITKLTELFLFEATRTEMFNKIIKPALNQRGSIVIADRFIDSTTAYQGFGRRLDLEFIEMANQMATEQTKPDITFLLDCPPNKGLIRVKESQMSLDDKSSSNHELVRIDKQGSSRFEHEPKSFHERVRSGYLKLAEQEPDRLFVINAENSIEEIEETIWVRVQCLVKKSEPEPLDQNIDLLSGLESKNLTN